MFFLCFESFSESTSHTQVIVFEIPWHSVFLFVFRNVKKIRLQKNCRPKAFLVHKNTLDIVLKGFLCFIAPNFLSFESSFIDFPSFFLGIYKKFLSIFFTMLIFFYVRDSGNVKKLQKIEKRKTLSWHKHVLRSITEYRWFSVSILFPTDRTFIHFY